MTNRSFLDKDLDSIVYNQLIYQTWRPLKRANLLWNPMQNCRCADIILSRVPAWLSRRIVFIWNQFLAKTPRTCTLLKELHVPRKSCLSGSQTFKGCTYVHPNRTAWTSPCLYYCTILINMHVHVHISTYNSTPIG